MTQKEINKEASVICNNAFDTFCDTDNDLTWEELVNIAKGKIADLVITTCQEDAIAFGGWLFKECYHSNSKTNLWRYRHHKEANCDYTTAQLYAIYLTDKNKEGV